MKTFSEILNVGLFIGAKKARHIVKKSKKGSLDTTIRCVYRKIKETAEGGGCTVTIKPYLFSNSFEVIALRKKLLSDGYTLSESNYQPLIISWEEKRDE